MTLPDSKAIWVAGSWLWYLSAYKKKYLCSHFHRDHSLFGPANKSSFKGCTQLRTPSWAVTWQLGKVCTHFTLHFWPAHAYDKKTTKIKNRKPTKKMPALWFSSKCIKTARGNIRIPDTQPDVWSNTYSLNLACPLFVTLKYKCILVKSVL